MSYKIKKLSQDVEIEFHNKFRAEMKLETFKNERLKLINNYNHYISNYKKAYITLAKDFEDDEARKQKDISMRISINYIYLISEVEKEIENLEKEITKLIEYFNLIKSEIVEKVIEKVVK